VAGADDTNYLQGDARVHGTRLSQARGQRPALRLGLQALHVDPAAAAAFTGTYPGKAATALPAYVVRGRGCPGSAPRWPKGRTPAGKIQTLRVGRHELLERRRRRPGKYAGASTCQETS
jgi:hypothetical protein